MGSDARVDTDSYLVDGAKEPEVNGKWAGRLLAVVARDDGKVTLKRLTAAGDAAIDSSQMRISDTTLAALMT